MTLTNENIHYCSAWAFHQLEWLERYTRDELVIKAKDLYVVMTTNMEQYELIESIILLRWKDRLGQTEDSWQQLSKVLSQLAAPYPMFAKATPMDWRVPLLFPRGTKPFVRNGFPGVTSPMVEGFLFTKDDLLQCSQHLLSLLLVCEGLDTYLNSFPIQQVDVLSSTCGNKDFAWEFGRSWYKAQLSNRDFMLLLLSIGIEVDEVYADEEVYLRTILSCIFSTATNNKYHMHISDRQSTIDLYNHIDLVKNTLDD